MKEMLAACLFNFFSQFPHIAITDFESRTIIDCFWRASRIIGDYGRSACERFQIRRRKIIFESRIYKDVCCIVELNKLFDIFRASYTLDTVRK